MTAQAYIVVAAVIAGLLLMAYLRSKKRWRDISIPMPSVLRDDLHYCYYLSLPGQMAATADHTNLLWHGQFYGLDQLASELSGHPHGMVFDCAPQLFRREGGKSHVSDDAAIPGHEAARTASDGDTWSGIRARPRSFRSLCAFYTASLGCCSIYLGSCSSKCR